MPFSPIQDDLLRCVLHIKDEQLQPLLDKAVRQFSIGHHKEAFLGFSELCKRTRYDHYPQLVFNRGLCYQRLGLARAALQDFEVSYNILQQPGILTAIQGAKVMSFKGVMLLFEEAKENFAREEYQTALEKFNKVLAGEPSYTDALLMRARTYEKLKEYIKGIDDACRAYDMFVLYGDKQDAIKYARRMREALHAVCMPDKREGDRCYSRKQWKQATAAYTRAIRLDPTFPTLFYNRGLAYEKMQVYGQALSDLCTAHKLFVRPDARLLAKEATDRLTGIIHAKAMPAKQEGDIFFEMKAWKSAEREYTRAIDIDPSFPHVYFNRGLVRNFLGMPVEAKTDFETARALFQRIDCIVKAQSCIEGLEKHLAQAHGLSGEPIPLRHVYHSGSTTAASQQASTRTSSAPSTSTTIPSQPRTASSCSNSTSHVPLSTSTSTSTSPGSAPALKAAESGQSAALPMVEKAMLLSKTATLESSPSRRRLSEAPMPEVTPTSSSKRSSRKRLFAENYPISPSSVPSSPLSSVDSTADIPSTPDNNLLSQIPEHATISPANLITTPKACSSASSLPTTPATPPEEEREGEEEEALEEVAGSTSEESEAQLTSGLLDAEADRSPLPSQEEDDVLVSEDLHQVIAKQVEGEESKSLPVLAVTTAIPSQPSTLVQAPSQLASKVVVPVAAQDDDQQDKENISSH